MSYLVLSGSDSLSTITASKMIVWIIDNLNEAVGRFWTDEMLLRWINAGIRDIAVKTLCNGSDESITLAADTLEYDLTDSSNAALVAAVYDNRKGIKKGHPGKVGYVHDVGEPEYFYYWNGKVGFYPVPLVGSAAIGKSIKLYLANLPDYINLTDTIPLPKNYEQPLVNFVTAEAWYRDQQDIRADKRKAMYEAEIDRYRIDFHEPEVDEESQ